LAFLVPFDHSCGRHWRQSDGGSLHYPLDTWKGNFYSRLERALMNSTDLFLFESAFTQRTRPSGVPTVR